MLKMFLLMLAAAAVFAADDPWQNVKDLKSGTDLRVFRRGSNQPLLVQMGELTDDNLVVIDKKAERAIPREEIDRIDSRPPSPPGSRKRRLAIRSTRMAGIRVPTLLVIPRAPVAISKQSSAAPRVHPKSNPAD